jgi:phage head maturation protease
MRRVRAETKSPQLSDNSPRACPAFSHAQHQSVAHQHNVKKNKKNKKKTKKIKKNKKIKKIKKKKSKIK